MDWFLYDNGLRHEEVNQIVTSQNKTIFLKERLVLY